MKKLLLFVLTFCLLLSLAACAQPPVPDPVPTEPPTPEKEIQVDPADIWVEVESNGTKLAPYTVSVWSETWTGDGFVSADYETFSFDDPNFADLLPAIAYADDFNICFGKDVTFSGFYVYELDRTPVPLEGDLSALSVLPAGDYIVKISTKERGRYVESEKRYETHGDDYYFRLSMPS